MLKRLVMLGALALGGTLIAKQVKQSGAANGRSRVRETTDVNVPVSTAYQQWADVEELPRFMENVREVRRLDHQRWHWRADLMGETVEWDAEITEQIPDQKIAWRSVSGTPHEGTVSFQRLPGDRTRITLLMRFEPQGPVERHDKLVEAVRADVRRNLQRFKELIEPGGRDTGAWRGAIGPDAGANTRR